MEEGECSPLALDDASEIDGGESTSAVRASTGDGTRKLFGSDGVVLGDCPPLAFTATTGKATCCDKRERVPTSNIY